LNYNYKSTQQRIGGDRNQSANQTADTPTPASSVLDGRTWNGGRITGRSRSAIQGQACRPNEHCTAHQLNCKIGKGVGGGLDNESHCTTMHYTALHVTNFM